MNQIIHKYVSWEDLKSATWISSNFSTNCGRVEELIDKYSFDFLALSETWLTYEISDSEIYI